MRKMFEKIKKGLKKMHLGLKEVLETLPAPSKELAYSLIRDAVISASLGTALFDILATFDIHKEIRKV